eukprot:11719804-Prorocentrum_lima.AAC.1
MEHEKWGKNNEKSRMGEIDKIFAWFRSFSLVFARPMGHFRLCSLVLARFARQFKPTGRSLF